MSNFRDSSRARRTLYVTGFHPKLTTKRLLEELFTQGGPVQDITMLETHAYVQFHHEDSVPYCLALFNEVELHGRKLRLNPRTKSKSMFCQLHHLAEVRKRLVEEYMNIPPPKLPPRLEPTTNKTQRVSSKRLSTKHQRHTPRKDSHEREQSRRDSYPKEKFKRESHRKSPTRQPPKSNRYAKTKFREKSSSESKQRSKRSEAKVVKPKSGRSQASKKTRGRNRL